MSRPYRTPAEMPGRPEPTWWDRVAMWWWRFVCLRRPHRFVESEGVMRCRCGASYPKLLPWRWLTAADVEAYFAAYDLARRLGAMT